MGVIAVTPNLYLVGNGIFIPLPQSPQQGQPNTITGSCKHSKKARDNFIQSLSDPRPSVSGPLILMRNAGITRCCSGMHGICSASHKNSNPRPSPQPTSSSPHAGTADTPRSSNCSTGWKPCTLSPAGPALHVRESKAGVNSAPLRFILPTVHEKPTATLIKKLLT